MPSSGMKQRALAVGEFLHYLFVRFEEDRGPMVAASLSFISVFSLVPAFAVVLPLLGAFPLFDEAWSSAQAFIFESFVPEKGTVILEYLRGSAKRAAGLSMVGILTLMTTLTMALSTVEHAFNKIWRVKVSRRLSSRLLMYWGMLTAGPLLLGAGFIATSYIVSLPMLRGAIGIFEAGGWWLRLLVWLTTLAAFTLLYFFVPNRRVPKRHAFTAAVVAAVLFELAKKLFAIYLGRVATYQLVFGAFAGVPAFLMWVYISWVLTLLGAEFSCCLTNYRAGKRAHGAPGMGLVYALRLAERFRQAQEAGRSVSISELQRGWEGIPWEEGPELLDQFEAAGIIHRTGSGNFAPSWNMDELTVSSLHRALDCPLPDPSGEWASRDGASSRLAARVAQARAGLESALKVSLKDL